MTSSGIPSPAVPPGLTAMISELQRSLAAIGPAEVLRESVMHSIAPGLLQVAEAARIASIGSNFAMSQALQELSKNMATSKLVMDPSWISQIGVASELAAVAQRSIAQSLPNTSLLLPRYSAMAVPRMQALSLGFQGIASGPADAFGTLQSSIAKDQVLPTLVGDALRIASRPGSFGLDYAGLGRAVEDLTSRLEEVPKLADEIDELMIDVQEAAGTSDELLLDMTNTLGFFRAVKGHRATGVAIVFGYTVGLVTFLAQGITPDSLVLAVPAGASVYYFVNKKTLEGAAGE